MREFIAYMRPRIDEYDELLSFNKIFIERTADVGVIDRETAFTYGCTGPVLRASGVQPVMETLQGVAAGSGAGIVLMHMRGTPQTMQDDPTYDDITREIFAYLRQRRDALVAAGIDDRRVCLDPGIGFGKTHQRACSYLRHRGVGR